MNLVNLKTIMIVLAGANAGFGTYEIFGTGPGLIPAVYGILSIGTGILLGLLTVRALRVEE